MKHYITSPNLSEDTRRGFSLMEFLIYLAVFGTVAGLFAGILGVAGRVEQRTLGASEVNTQLNYILQRVQGLVRTSSNIEAAENADNPETGGLVEQAYLKLRMKKDAEDPTCVSLVGGAVRIATGDGGNGKCKVTTTADDVTTNKVVVPLNGLTFTKYANPPGKDVVEITLILNSASQNPASAFSQTFRTAVGRASAATFESNLLPASPPPDIGTPLTPWENGYIRNLDVSGTFKDPANYDGGAGGQRGYKTIGIVNSTLLGLPNSTNCSAVCSSHNLSCGTYLQLYNLASPPGIGPNSCTFNPPDNTIGTCYCY